MGSRSWALLAFAGYTLAASPAFGDVAPDRARSGTYYALNGALIAGLLGATLVARGALPTAPGADPTWFPGDRSVRRNWSPAAAELSNVTLVLTLSAPALALLGGGANLRLLNAGVVYGETLSADLALNSLTKVLFARPRPYTYGPGAKDPSIDDPDERYVSFYSGHASMAFASAIAGSYLFAEGAPSQGSRVALWATELTLATATANLRVRAGKHYYSDAVAGALTGIGLGIGIPLLHGASYVPRASEYVAAGSGFVAGALLSELLPLRNLAADQPVGALLRGLSVGATGRGAVTVSLAGTL